MLVLNHRRTGCKRLHGPRNERALETRTGKEQAGENCYFSSLDENRVILYISVSSSLFLYFILFLHSLLRATIVNDDIQSHYCCLSTTYRCTVYSAAQGKNLPQTSRKTAIQSGVDKDTIIVWKKETREETSVSE